MTNINIEVPDDDYHQFKLNCVVSNITVKDKIIELIKRSIKLKGKNE